MCWLKEISATQARSSCCTLMGPGFFILTTMQKKFILVLAAMAIVILASFWIAHRYPILQTIDSTTINFELRE